MCVNILKKYILLFSFLSFLTAYSQNYNFAIYDLKIENKSFSKFLYDSDFDSFQKQIFKKMFNAANTAQISLSFDKNLSECKSIKSLNVGAIDNKLLEGSLFILLGLHKVFYFNNKSKIIYYERGRGDVVHLVKSQAEILKWKVGKEQKKVGTHIYRKATAYINNDEEIGIVTAWFCPDISVPFGPSVFFGLPGLITEVYVEGDYKYSFILNKLKKKKNLSIEVPLDEYKVLSKTDSDKLFDELVKDRKN